MRLARRAALTLLAAGALAPAAGAHTLYSQWVVYRRKHLLVGSHREDPRTFALAEETVRLLDHFLPEARARAARAPRPERLASLMGTGQMDVAVLTPDDLAGMRAGTGSFAPYGPIPLTRLTDLGAHVLTAHPDLPDHHAWLIAAALDEARVPFRAPGDGVARHPGVEAYLAGTPLEAVSPGG